MQELKFVNGNGSEINLTSGNFGITNWAGLGNTNLNIQTQQVPYNDGSVFIDGLFQDRTLSFTLAINDNNDLELRYELKRKLISALNPKLNEGYLYYKNDYLQKRIKVVPQLPIFNNKNSNDSGTLKASLSFTSCSVYWEDVEETTVYINQSENINIQNSGDVEIEPIISFKTGAAENVVLRNITNKTKVSISNEISNSELNLTKGNKTFYKKTLGFFCNSNFSRFVENSDFQLMFGDGIVKTDDFKDFETINIPTNETIMTTCYGNGFFVYGGNYLKKSTDGKTWETLTKPVGDVSASFFDDDNNTFYFVIGTSFYSSTDLENFTLIGSATYALNSIFKQGNNIYVVGNEGQCFQYTIGGSWTSISTGTTEIIYDITGDGTNIVIVGTNKLCKYSNNNGSTWTTITVPETISSICYSKVNKNYYFAGANGCVGYGLIDNLTWETIGTQTRTFCRVSKIFGFIEFLGEDILIYANGEFIKKTDYPTDAVCAVYFKNKYIAGGLNGNIYISEDFINWTKKEYVGQIENDIYFAEINNNNAYFITKNGDIIYTPDGEIFYIQPKINLDVKTIQYFNGKYYAFTIDAIYIISTSGTAEKIYDLQTPSNNSWYSYVVNNKLIACTEDIIIVTDDGETFSEYSNPNNLVFWAYYNNQYVASLFMGEGIFTTTDFENFTQLFSNMGFGALCVLNGVLYLSEVSFANDVISTNIYQSDLITNTLLVSENDFYLLEGFYHNGAAYFSGRNTTGRFKTLCNNDVFNYYAVVANNRFYQLVQVPDSDDVNIIYNDQIINNSPLFEAPEITQDIALVKHTKEYIKLPIGEMLNSPYSSITAVYADSEKLYIASGSSIYSQNKFTRTLIYNGTRSIDGFTGDNNYLYALQNYSSSYKYLIKIDKKTYTALPTINVPETSETTIQNNSCIVAGDFLIWATSSKLVSYNLVNKIKTEIVKNITILDFVLQDNIVYGLGTNGILFSVDMESIEEIYNNRFTFTKFVREKLDYFVGFYGAFGNINFLTTDNLISQITDISLILSKGNNELILTSDSGFIAAVLTYRQKYVGV